MKKIVYIIAIITQILITSSCENKSRHTESIVNDTPSIEGQSIPDTVSLDCETSPKIIEKQSTQGKSSSLPSRTHKSGKYNNMRGFDPASEDDMDDNGMSRYMENNDDEGWD